MRPGTSHGTHDGNARGSGLMKGSAMTLQGAVGLARIASVQFMACIATFACVSNLCAAEGVESIEGTVYRDPVGGGTYRFTIERKKHADPKDSWGAVPRLRIVDPSQRTLLIEVDAGLVPLSDAFPSASGGSTLIQDNLLSSKYLYLTPKIRDATGRPLLMAFGWGFDSHENSLRVIALGGAKGPMIAFSSNSFGLSKIIDFDQDGATSLIGREKMIQTGGCGQQYVPFLVYRFSRSGGGTFQFSEELSKRYNEQNYVGWVPRPEWNSYEVDIYCREPKGSPKLSRMSDPR